MVWEWLLYDYLFYGIDGLLCWCEDICNCGIFVVGIVVINYVIEGVIGEWL